MKKKKKSVYQFICPHCGSIVQSDAACCPGCGSDTETGWSDAAHYTHLLPGDNESSSGKKKSRPWVKFTVIGITLLLVCLLLPFLFPQGIYLVPAVLIGSCVVFFIMYIYPLLPGTLERDAEKELLNLLHGDRAQMDRLLLHEMMRKPDTTRIERINTAIFRILRDRR